MVHDAGLPAFKFKLMVPDEVPHQANTVSIVAKIITGSIDNQRIHCARTLGPLTAPCCQPPGFLFERYGYVESFAIVFSKSGYRMFEVADINPFGCVYQLLPGLLGKAGMNERRFTMLNRVAENRIAVDII